MTEIICYFVCLAAFLIAFIYVLRKVNELEGLVMRLHHNFDNAIRDLYERSDIDDKRCDIIELSIKALRDEFTEIKPIAEDEAKSAEALKDIMNYDYSRATGGDKE